MSQLLTEIGVTCGPKNPFGNDPPRRDRDDPWKRRIDESSTPLPGESDYSDDDDDDKDAGHTTDNDN
jgi:hypothetical protein